MRQSSNFITESATKRTFRTPHRQLGESIHPHRPYFRYGIMYGGVCDQVVSPDAGVRSPRGYATCLFTIGVAACTDSMSKDTSEIVDGIAGTPTLKLAHKQAPMM